MIREAKYYKKMDNNEVECLLCPHRCKISEGQRGLCDVRFNREGVLYTEIYGIITAFAIDPVEKKPLYHFYPGGKILSLSSYGCNMKCPYCQNYHISLMKPDSYYTMSPKELIKRIDETQIGLIAFTYNEPFIWFEYLMDILPILKEKGKLIVFVTNGLIGKEPLKELLPYIDAVNIDLKSGDEDVYKKELIGDKKTVENVIKILFNNNVFVEVTRLIVPQDYRREEFTNSVKLIASISKEIPLHITRYFPMYKHRGSPTPEFMLQEAYNIAKEYLHYVYVGNADIVPSHTYCPYCGELVVERYGYRVTSYLKDDKCPHCGKKLYFRV